ncbi:extracellular solute-binding protein [Mollicutes bacterium LVI A0039]|nr:extracellular solute-binding protein [Mollicutes bacterium LVI A0039]
MKKLIAVLFTMILVLAGCSSGSKTSSEAYDLEDQTLPLAEPVTLKFMTQSSVLAPEDPNDKLIWQRYQEKTNIEIEWNNYTNDQYETSRNLAISSGDLPDAIFDAGMSDYDLLTNGANGVIIPLEDYITEDIMPNLYKILSENPEYKSIMTAADGHVYSFPWIEELGEGKQSIHSIDCIPWINQEWLDNLGLKMPTTTEELKSVLIAFRDEDADGDGDKTNEIPMSFVAGAGGESPVSIYGAFGMGDNWDHTMVDENGKVLFSMNQEGYKDAIKYMNELQQENLLDPEVFTQDYNTYASKGQEQKYGLYFTWDTGNIAGFESGDYSNPEEIVSNYAPLHPLSANGNEPNVSRTNGMGFDRGRFVMTSANLNPILTARWVDGLYEPSQSVQNNWGTYGDETQQNIFDLNSEGMLTHNTLDGTAPVELRQKTAVSGPLAVLDEYYGDVTTMPNDAKWRLDIIEEVYAPHFGNDNTYPKVFYSVEDQTRLTDIEAAMLPYAEAMTAEWITNGGIDEGWDKYIEELDRYGLQEWLEIKQKYYDESQK